MEKLAVCRICLNANGQLVIEDPQLQELYERLTTLPTTDMRPLALCYICHGQLNASRRLMLKCLKAEELLTQMLHQLKTNEDVELNRITMDRSALNQWSICIADQTIIDNAVQHINKEQFSSHFEINVKLEEQNVEEHIETVCSIDSEPDNEQALSDPGDNTPTTPCSNMKQNIEKPREQDAASDGLKQGASIANEPYIEFEVKNSPNIVNYVNKATGENTDKTNKTGIYTDRIQIKRENSTATNDVKSDSKMCQQRSVNSELSYNNDGQSTSVDVSKTRICIHSESGKTFCDICKNNFTSRYALMKHIRKHPDVRPHVCGCCRKCYNHPSGYPTTPMANTYTAEKPYTCQVCNKRFTHKSLLKSHELIPTGVKRYPCNVCNRKFTYISLLKSHACTKEKPHVCNVCKMSFNRKNDLNKHMFIHTGGKRYVCNVCKKTFYQMCHLRIHARIHTGEKPYACNVCKKCFSQKSYLKIHSRIHTGGKTYVRKKIEKKDDSASGREDNVYVCDVCGKRFDHKGVFTRHVRLVHIGDRPYVCEICKKRFRLRCELSYHTRFHTGEKPYSCNVCDKSFHQKSTLTRHAIIHTGEKPYVCNVCNKAFNQKAILNGHLRTHTGEKPYNCDVCDKKFKSRSDLTKHKLLHTDDRRHACNVCGRRFHRKTTLKRHSRVHTGEKPYGCNICDERFKHSSTLNSHMQIHNL